MAFLRNPNYQDGITVYSKKPFFAIRKCESGRFCKKFNKIDRLESKEFKLTCYC
ncbi:hypothetical protein HMPREF1054_1460 [Haemophilus paraphrohaemolyticus HK411]|uniref:Uncharacterized protein n=1 Tax=Haemophilus paraphrohaemolyticus HK411 TaxID=1095743 RepID=I2NPF0_9PAST|nr:hypothetical protein HMPREF1054_1460 [Haemophilus paraphrohaemolyticus HK411]